MPKQCPDCERIYPDFVDYCVADGAFVQRYIPPPDTEETQPLSESTTASLDLKEEVEPEVRARLFPKVNGKPGTFGVEFSSDVVLGRFDPDAGVVDVDLSGVSESESISPRHAPLTVEDEQWYVEDIGSENGVFINGGERITEVLPLNHGDEIALGSALFVFETELVDGNEDNDENGDEDVTDALVGVIIKDGEHAGESN